VASVIISLGLFWYVGLVIANRIKTVVASWIVSTVALTLSLVTYFGSPHANWLGGSLNAASVFAVFSTLIAVYVRAHHNGEDVIFNSFQKRCLVASGGITILWIVIVLGMKGTGIIPNLLTQLLLIISYAMLIVKFWKAEKNTESLFTWWCVFIASVIAIYTALKKNDVLAFVYAVRSTVMCGILIYVLHRLEWKIIRH
jgi:hypothetical protein